MDGYMQRGVLQALNPLSNRVTFTAIVPGAYPWEAKMCQLLIYIYIWFTFCFHVAAPVVWNALPVYLRSTSISRGQFRAGLKTHLFNQAYNILRTFRFKSVLYLLTYWFWFWHWLYITLICYGSKTKGSFALRTIPYGICVHTTYGNVRCRSVLYRM